MRTWSTDAHSTTSCDYITRVPIAFSARPTTARRATTCVWQTGLTKQRRICRAAPCRWCTAPSSRVGQAAGHCPRVSRPSTICLRKERSAMSALMTLRPRHLRLQLSAVGCCYIQSVLTLRDCNRVRCGRAPSARPNDSAPSGLRRSSRCMR